MKRTLWQECGPFLKIIYKAEKGESVMEILNGKKNISWDSNREDPFLR